MKQYDFTSESKKRVYEKNSWEGSWGNKRNLFIGSVSISHESH